MLYIYTVPSAESEMFLPGVYRKGEWVINSLADKAARQSAGARCCVVRLRFMGTYLPYRLLLRRPWPEGLFVSTDLRNGFWSADLHPLDGDSTPLLRTLIHAQLIKERDDGCWLVGGKEADFGELGNWPQTWLCAPNEGLARHALDGMDSWLAGQHRPWQVESR